MKNLYYSRVNSEWHAVQCYNATSGHAVIYVGPYDEASAISMVVHRVTLFDWVCNHKSPVSSVAF